MQARPLLKDFVEAEAALRELCACVDETDEVMLAGAEIQPADMPPEYQALLVHNGHMTPKLSGHHGGPVSLTVLSERREGPIYNRKIVLTAPNSHAVVELGIVRMNLDYTRREVRDAILGRSMPLGDILNRHEVLTRVDPQWYMRFARDGVLRDRFTDAVGESLYGRIGTIYVHDQPAVELLEIVTDGSTA